LAGPGDAPTTIGEACDNYDRANGGRRRGTVWCRCIDRVLTPRYPPAELTKVLENPTALMERISVAPGGDIHDRVPAEYLVEFGARRLVRGHDPSLIIRALRPRSVQ
jgi:hypothetical protein